MKKLNKTQTKELTKKVKESLRDSIVNVGMYEDIDILLETKPNSKQFEDVVQSILVAAKNSDATDTYTIDYLVFTSILYNLTNVNAENLDKEILWALYCYTDLYERFKNAFEGTKFLLYVQKSVIEVIRDEREIHLKSLEDRVVVAMDNLEEYLNSVNLLSNELLSKFNADDLNKLIKQIDEQDIQALLNQGK